MTAGRSTMQPMIVACALLVTLPGLTMAQDVPQTAWGAPDLQGVWDFRTITPLERPEDLGDQAFLTAEEAAQREQSAVDRAATLWNREARPAEAGGSVGGYNKLLDGPGHERHWDAAHLADHRSVRTGDFRRSQKPGKRGRQPTAGPSALSFRPSYTDLSNSDRCLMGFNAGPPITPAAYNQNVQLFQTPDHFVMLTEMVHTVRVIPIDGSPALGDGLRQLSGVSRGHWEGETLVVETANFEARRDWRGSTEGMRLVERFTRVDADTLEYEFTVTDPETWAAPWTVNLPMRRNELPLFEYACHEGNYAMEVMLRGARADEKAEGGK